MDVLHNTICYVEARGIDEAFLKLPLWACTQKQVISLSKQIKQQLSQMYKEHIRCSIGVGSNVWQAKMASNCQKPNGYTAITTQNASQWYQKWQLTDLNGVNRRMAKQFALLGIQSPFALYNAPYWLLNRFLGVNGAKWYLRMRGIEVDIAAPSVNKMIGHQITTLPNAPQNIEGVTTYCIRISTTLGKRLRNKSLYARYLGLQVSFIDFQSSYLDLKLSRSISTDAEIMLYSKMLLKKLHIIQPVRRISMVLSDLTSVYQPDLPLDLVNRKQFTASQISDVVNDRFGGEVLLPASSFFARSIQLDRVGFGGDQVKESYKHNIKYL
jgi:DNA polymerase-4